MICEECSANMEERTIYMTKDGAYCKRCYPIIEKNQSMLNLNNTKGCGRPIGLTKEKGDDSIFSIACGDNGYLCYKCKESQDVN